MDCIKCCPIKPKAKTIEWNFDAPAGESIGKYRIVRDEIEDKIRELLPKLQN